MAKGKYEKWLEPENLLLIEGWARDGLTEEQIAHNMGITRKTLFNWREKYLPILHALKKGKENVDRQVENSLFRKANGYNAQVKKTFKLKEVYYDENGRRCEKEKLVTAIDETHIPPDTTAIIFWLKNRKPDVWRDKINEEQELSPPAININITPATKEMSESD